MQSGNSDPDIRARADKMLADAGYSVPGQVTTPPEPLIAKRTQVLIALCLVTLAWYALIATNPMVNRAKAFIAADPSVTAVVGHDPDIWTIRMREWGGQPGLQATHGRYQFVVRGTGRVHHVEIDVWQNDGGETQFQPTH